jgi:DNA-binding CsgD family transcriptional regulator
MVTRDERIKQLRAAGYSLKEIASQMDIPESTVRKIIRDNQEKEK